MERSNETTKQIGNNTIHVNLKCAVGVNKILVNKEKWYKCVRGLEQTKAPMADKIYYNPKFLVPTLNSTSVNLTNQSTFRESINLCRNHSFLINGGQQKDDTINCNNNNNDIFVNKQNRSAIHINPQFLMKQQEYLNKTEMLTKNRYDVQTANISSKVILDSNKKKDVKQMIKSKYRLVKKVNSSPKVESSAKPICIKTKYTLKRLPAANMKNKKENRISDKLKLNNTLKARIARQSLEFKKFSRTKLISRSVLQSRVLARWYPKNNLFKKSLTEISRKRSPLKKTFNMICFSKGNYTAKCSTPINNSFKRLGNMKIVRKSLLKEKIEARNNVKKQYLRDRKHGKNYSTFKLCNNKLKERFISDRRILLKWRKKKQGSDVSRVKGQKLNITPTIRSLRKNNQPCPFYNRFGRCKGKDRGTCPKLHNPLYIGICRKILQGECNSKDCLLSHDVRPGKMPTCHHYLAGLCTRSNCPFLHIKVNPKAPICISFLQGYCPDVFNCMKRHEFICPIYAEKNTCPRGKSCTYPHRSPIVHSKLLLNDQQPLIHHPIKNVNSSEVSNKVDISLDKEKNSYKKELESVNIVKKPKKEFVKESFIRYFAMPVNNNNSPCDSDNEEISRDETVQ